METQKTNNKIKTNVCLKHKNYVPPYINQVSLVVSGFRKCKSDGS